MSWACSRAVSNPQQRHYHRCGRGDWSPGSLLTSSTTGMPIWPSGPWSLLFPLLSTLPSLQVTNPWVQVSLGEK